ncbi:hypothetical protein KP509_28G059500 [Ceratopteris richardii]|uniref:CDC20/Fizzy WD40 domain-containing protein n=1 Tax=Ceratopteris richardii TaxID=49495 RepID=A0A8T2RF10_CERRI|nr:hypothetical protein KP509_28G059500 [Ceratopteris richardii]
MEHKSYNIRHMFTTLQERQGCSLNRRRRSLGLTLTILPPPRKPGSQNGYQGDRYIPSRSAMDLDIARFNLLCEAKENTSMLLNITSPIKEEYRKKLAENLLQEKNAKDGKKILVFKKKKRSTLKEDERLNYLLYCDKSGARKSYRHIPHLPERILDAPELVDDYYLNLLDWSSKNVLAVALGTAVYLWNAESGAISQLMQTSEDDDYVTSIAWATDGKHIAVGINSMEVQIWDASKGSQVRRMSGHTARVGSLAWNGPTLSSGGRDSRIINHDVRARDHIASTLKGHSQEVCGLSWSPSGQQLASGGNDNLLHIWDVASTEYLYRLSDHQAAVKALAWCPFQAHLLASGGGTADRCIKVWNTQKGTCLNSLDTQSQVCALVWSRHYKEILSSHGYSKNQLCLWRYPSMVKIAELTGHTARVLHLAQSPEGTTVVSAAADETLRFWKVFVASDKSNAIVRMHAKECGSLLLKAVQIR